MYSFVFMIKRDLVIFLLADVIITSLMMSSQQDLETMWLNMESKTRPHLRDWAFSSICEYLRIPQDGKKHQCVSGCRAGSG